MQVAEVTRALLSVSKAVDAGNRVVFDEQWSYLENKKTGERTTIKRRGGLYVMESWVRARKDGERPRGVGQPFGRPGLNK